jgi:hypothetical protein
MNKIKILMIAVAITLFSCEKDDFVEQIDLKAASFDKILNINDSCVSVNKIIQTNDLGYLLIGGVSSPTSSPSAYVEDYLVKLDKYGSIQWKTKYTDHFSDDGFIDGFETSDQNFLIYSRRGLEPGSLPSLVEVSKSGIINHITEMDIDFYAKSIFNLNSGQVLLFGLYFGNTAIQVVNTSGAIISVTEFDSPAKPTDMIKLGSGNFVYIGGLYTGDGNNLNQITPSGNVVWGKSYKGYKLAPTSDNGFMAHTEISKYESKLIKFNTNGEEQWTVNYDNIHPNSYYDNVYFAAEINSGNILYTYGSYYQFSYYFNIKILDSEGNQLKEETLDVAYDTEYAIERTRDNGLIMTMLGKN